ncbi:hypothetical protein LY78DRAFT_208316 [Colletotrichum sublineola]|nr:hypothetical protein LY78DRAFT_208316 [Colletotrichum sublineola]
MEATDGQKRYDQPTMRALMSESVLFFATASKERGKGAEEHKGLLGREQETASFDISRRKPKASSKRGRTPRNGSARRMRHCESAQLLSCKTAIRHGRAAESWPSRWAPGNGKVGKFVTRSSKRATHSRVLPGWHLVGGLNEGLSPRSSPATSPGLRLERMLLDQVLRPFVCLWNSPTQKGACQEEPAWDGREKKKSRITAWLANSYIGNGLRRIIALSVA